MAWKRSSALALGVAVTVFFAAGLWRLFALQAVTHHHLPPYSSLRADPLGTRAFHDALAALPGISVQRNFHALDLGADPEPATVFVAGFAPSGDLSVTEDWVKRLESVALKGGRVVIAFSPIGTDRATARPADDAPAPRKSAEAPEETEAPEKAEAPEEAEKTESETPDQDTRTRRGFRCGGPGCGLSEEDLLSRWGLQRAARRLPLDADRYRPVSADRIAGAPLPESLLWRSAVFFRPRGGEWRTIYAREGLPVMVERDYGTGSIVVTSDAFPLSNESMREERQSDLLAWLVGPHRRVVFEECHLGLEQYRGVMALARRYGARSLVVVALLLAALFVWRNATSLTPRHTEARHGARAPRAQGRDALAGLRSVLRRSIPVHGVLAVCIEEWKRSCGSQRPADDATEDEIEAIARRVAGGGNQGDVAEAYREICRALAERK